MRSLKNVPGPEKYKLEYEWVKKSDIEKGKRRPTKTNRDTFIDLILKDGKKKPVPGK